VKNSTRTEPRRTPNQRFYDQLTDLERRLTELLDGIPYCVLDADSDTGSLLRESISHLEAVTDALDQVQRREEPRFNSLPDDSPVRAETGLRLVVDNTP
jgi:hypothetical protein